MIFTKSTSFAAPFCIILAKCGTEFVNIIKLWYAKYSLIIRRWLMDWTKLNMAEVNYYCKSYDVDFDCYPFDCQMEQIVLMFYHYGINQFTVKDIQEFYKKMQIPKMKSDGVIKPVPSRIKKVAERMENVKIVSDGIFEIVPAENGLYLPFDTSLYTSDIDKGYQKHRI